MTADAIHSGANATLAPVPAPTVTSFPPAAGPVGSGVTLTPTSLAGSKITLTAQPQKGACCMQATIAATATNMAATTPWLTFKVK